MVQSGGASVPPQFYCRLSKIILIEYKQIAFVICYNLI